MTQSFPLTPAPTQALALAGPSRAPGPLPAEAPLQPDIPLPILQPQNPQPALIQPVQPVQPLPQPVVALM